jgi:hypothetical protein
MGWLLPGPRGEPLDPDDILAIKRARRKVLIGVSVAGLLLTAPWWLGIAIFILGPRYQDWAYRIPFDSEAWISDATVYPGRRQNMVADLLARYPLRGLSEHEVEQLLGRPTWTEAAPPGGVTYHYVLGPDRHTLGPEYDLLELKIRGGKVVQVQRRSTN